MIALEVYLIEKGKRTICSVYILPTDQVTAKDMRDFLEELPVHNPLPPITKINKQEKNNLKKGKMKFGKILKRKVKK